LDYLWWKLVHVLAVVLFLGNIVTGIFWKGHADRTGDPRLMAHAVEGVILSDRWFTLPGVALIVVGGVGAAVAGDWPILGTGWILWSLALFGISGLAFTLRVAPLQRRLAHLAREGAERGPFDRAAYDAASRRWGAWGLVALLTPLLAAALMVLKPELPAP
jgi:uncharacterized membrane protein